MLKIISKVPTYLLREAKIRLSIDIKKICLLFDFRGRKLNQCSVLNCAVRKLHSSKKDYLVDRSL